MKNPGLFLFICCCILCLSCSKPAPQERENKTPETPSINDLPRMTVTASDLSAVNLRELKGKTMLILFQPDCDHCHREAQEIRKHLDQFNEYSLYFISAGEMPAIEEFGRTYDLLGHSNIKFAATTVENVLSNFGPISAPSIYIYVDQKLVKKFNGEVGIDLILQAL
jgi:peroxiredoxin